MPSLAANTHQVRMGPAPMKSNAESGIGGAESMEGLGTSAALDDAMNAITYKLTSAPGHRKGRTTWLIGEERR